MKRSDLSRRGLAYYWRSHLGVLCGVAVTTAVIVGAMLVGDSLRHSLKQLAEQRLMGVEQSMLSPDRFFRAELAGDLSKQDAADTLFAPVLYLNASASNSDGSARVNKVQVFGVSDEFWRLGGLDPNQVPFQSEGDLKQLVINDVLAKRLGAQKADSLVVRVANPALLPRDAPFSTEEDVTLAIRADVVDVVGPERFGRFSLKASQVAQPTVFVPISYLQERVDLAGKANLMLSGNASGPTSVAMRSLSDQDAGVKDVWRLEDSGMQMIDVPELNAWELRTDRVFIDAIVDAASKATGLEQQRFITYFGNAFISGTNVAPFSMIAGVEDVKVDTPFLPADLAANEVVINDWVAHDLNAKVGDDLTVQYYVIGPKRTLEEQATTFKIKQVIPMQGLARDPLLMPNLPGISDQEDCSDWEPGMPLDLSKVRDKDEKYWDDFRGTPKGFIHLSAGQKLWENRFGRLTSIRYSKDGLTREALEAAILKNLDPASYGLSWIPLREEGLRAGAEGIDLGQYFAGMSFFIIVSALALGFMLFLFGIEQRRDEVAALFAMGYRAKLIKRLLFREAIPVLIVGGLLGVLGGMLYTHALLWGLASAWTGAIGDTLVHFHATPGTLITGLLTGVILGMGVLAWALRRFGKKTIHELFAGGGQPVKPGKQRAWLRVVGIMGLLGGLGMGFGSLGKDAETVTMSFYGGGGLFLLGGLCLSAVWLARKARLGGSHALTIRDMGVRNLGRQRGRGLVVIGTLAAGIYMVVSVGAFRQFGGPHNAALTSGTGGFAFIGESAQAVYLDMNSEKGREKLWLDDAKFTDVQFHQMRLREGDDASCLNLNMAQRPRLLGMNPADMKGRFSFMKVDGDAEDPWALLDAPQEDPDVIPAIGDYNSIMYALKSGIGKTIPYVDEQGNTFRLKMVAGAKNSILQGSLFISEKHFVERFPSASGYRYFLVDAPEENRAELAQALGKSLKDIGPEIVSADARLAELNNVMNAYISVFQALGGLGVLLGSLGLGVIVLRNVFERRREFGVLRALGFPLELLRRMIFSEHLALFLAGMFIGCAAALLTVLPAFLMPDIHVPWFWMIALVLGLAASGLLWISIASCVALKSHFLDALRNE
ncbi:MAG: putative ABC transport system permease protein [Candidatus Omnitrophota bacterium]|jgi:putative ABC transport system permease protein